MTEIKQYSAIDYGRWLMSIVVIAIHVNVFFPIRSENAIKLFELSELAVPYFFITSGFFFALRDSVTTKYYLQHIINKYVFWTAVYLPLTIFYYINSGASFAAALTSFTQRLFLVGENYYSFHLWFLLALIQCILLFLVCKYLLRDNLNANTIIFIFGIILFIAGRGISFLAGNSVLPFLHIVAKKYMQVFVTTRNGPLFGFVFFSAGICIAHKKDYFADVKAVIIAVCFLASTALNYMGIFVAQILQASCLWLLFYIISVKANRNFNTKAVRRMSELNYYIHMYPISILSFLLPKERRFTSAMLIALLLTFSIVMIVSFCKKLSYKNSTS